MPRKTINRDFVTASKAWQSMYSEVNGLPRFARNDGTFVDG